MWLAAIAAGLNFAACQQLTARPDAAAPGADRRFGIALVHLAPEAGDLEGNRAAILQGLRVAAEAGADLVVTPELAVSGYAFADLRGTDWIEPMPSRWLREVQGVVRELGITAVVGMPERDAETGLLHNAMVAIGPDGEPIGRHRKVRTLKVGSESWSSPGSVSEPFDTALGAVGMFVCADAVDTGIASTLKRRGAELLISSANWAPGLYGPDGEWERCSAATSLPVFVCNRTGVGRTLDFTAAESVVVCGGERRITLTSAEPAVFLITWDRAAGEPVGHLRLPL